MTLSETDRNAVSAAIVLALFLFAATHAAGVADIPAHPDSLRHQTTPHEESFGAGTSWMIGMTLVEQGDLAGALPYLAQAWRLSPDELELSRIYRDVLTELGYARDALDVSRMVLAMDPDDPVDREQHAVILAGLERYDEAIEEIAKLRPSHPDSLRLDRLRGEMLVRSGRLDEAEGVFETLLADGPDDAERLIATLADIALLAGDVDRAGELWHQAVSDDPESGLLRMGLIRFAAEQARDDEAFTAARAADRDGCTPPGPHDMSWTVMTAGLVLGAGRHAAAVEGLHQAELADELSLDGVLFLCRMLAAESGDTRAVTILRRAVDRWPDQVRPRMFLGEFLASAGDYEAAEEAVRSALTLAPDDAESRFSLISILSRRHPAVFEEERDATADAARDEIIASARILDADGASYPAPSHMMLGATFHALGFHADAISHFETAADDPDVMRDALLNLSIVYDDLDHQDDLLDVLDRLYRHEPEDPVVLNALGYTLADQDRELDRAEAMIRTALDTDPENPAYLDSMGWVLFRQDRFLDAFDHLVRAANAQPEDPVILEHLARVLMALGQTDRARGVAQQALAAGGDPDHLADLVAPSEDGR